MKQFIINFFLNLFLLANSIAYGQSIYSLTSGKIYFYAGTPVEDIEATNSKSISFINIKTGDIQLSIPNSEFKFKRALMEEHFNENYMETTKFPKSEFKGKILQIENYDLSAEGDYKLTVEGTLSIHGVAVPRKIDVNLKNTGGKLAAYTEFKVPLADHKIDRPQLLFEKLAEIVDVKATLNYALFKK